MRHGAGTAVARTAGVIGVTSRFRQGRERLFSVAGRLLHQSSTADQRGDLAGSRQALTELRDEIARFLDTY